MMTTRKSAAIISSSLLLIGGIVLLCTGYNAQLNWTPIYVPRSGNQVDLWTMSSSGCKCDFDNSRTDCACCIKPGGCQCGSEAPNKCAQCSLQQHCNNMCNMTISSRTILAESGTMVGQIKSPSLQGPTLCWYLLQPDHGFRLELQIYRLVMVGRFNGTSCQHGYLHLTDEVDAKMGTSGVQICGENERFSPPVVLFADKGSSTLIFRVDETTSRSQFLAYFSFTPYNNTQGLGFRPKGGKRMESTGCDWLYQDFSCVSEQNGCVLASPGYPGLYPAHVTCKYHITTSSLRTKVRITFNWLSLPLNRCATDYINIYQGTSSSSPLLATLCSNKKQNLVYSGPNLLIEFKSGISVPPYDYNGFVANLEFTDKSQTTSQLPPLSTVNAVDNHVQTNNSASTHLDNMLNAEKASATSDDNKPWYVHIYGNVSRSGHFDTRTVPWSQNCTFIFVGRMTDLIHISFFNYRMSEPSCFAYIEILDGNALSSVHKSIKRICSPVTKYARNADGRFHDQQTFLSTGNVLSILFKRVRQIPQQQAELEYIDGAFNFLDEYAEGTLQPNTLCDVVYYGVSSSPIGRIYNHGAQHLFWNIEGPLRCTQQFVPASNQSISLKILALSQLSSDVCHTECGDNGCHCVLDGGVGGNSSSSSLSTDNDNDFDRLIVLNNHNQVLTCICGYFQKEWLPVTVRSWLPLTVVYSVAKYSWSKKGFGFEAEYKFKYDGACGQRYIPQHSGSIQPSRIIESEELNYYYNQECIWILDSNVERELLVEFDSNQNRPCTAWNITVYEYSEHTQDHCGHLLRTFCSRGANKELRLAWKLNIVVIKLNSMSRTLPWFTIKWNSQIVRMNTRLAVMPSEKTLSAASASSLLQMKNSHVKTDYCYYYVHLIIRSSAISSILLIIHGTSTSRYIASIGC